jgi:cell wall-associated NlpC family hydrolase
LTAAPKAWWDHLLEALAGLWTDAQLARAGAGPEALRGAVSTQQDLPTGYDRVSEEARERAAVVAYMRSQVGDRYKYGAEILPGQEADAQEGDCSEYNEAAFRVAGKPIPDGVVNQRAFCRRIRVEAIKPADLLCLAPNAKGIPHVMVCTGEGTVVHALGGVGVVEQPIGSWLAHPRFDGAWRHPEWMRPPEDRA